MAAVGNQIAGRQEQARGHGSLSSSLPGERAKRVFATRPGNPSKKGFFREMDARVKPA
jgi:hypothetical protein